jgi:hypothetical protein
MKKALQQLAVRLHFTRSMVLNRGVARLLRIDRV